MTLPDETTLGFQKAVLLEGGGLAIHDVDKDKFTTYCANNWKSMIEDLDSLPTSILLFDTIQHAKDFPVEVFVAACESLPPQQYTALLERLVSKLEEGKVSANAVSEIFDGGTPQKQFFVAVNWQDSKIQNILDRAISATSKDETKVRDHLFSLKKGELAEAYLVNRESESPLPQTLPGIKLSDDQGFLAKAKGLISHGHSSESAGAASGLKSSPEGGDSTSGNLQIWLAGLAILILLVALYQVMKKKRVVTRS